MYYLVFSVSFIAVSIYRDDSVRYFHLQIIPFGFIQNVMRTLSSIFLFDIRFCFRKVHLSDVENITAGKSPNTRYLTVGFCRNFQIPTYLFHPFTSASSYRYNTFFAFIAAFFHTTLSPFQSFQLCLPVDQNRNPYGLSSDYTDSEVPHS